MISLFFQVRLRRQNLRQDLVPRLLLQHLLLQWPYFLAKTRSSGWRQHRSRRLRLLCRLRRCLHRSTTAASPSTRPELQRRSHPPQKVACPIPPWKFCLPMDRIHHRSRRRCDHHRVPPQTLVFWACKRVMAPVVERPPVPEAPRSRVAEGKRPRETWRYHLRRRLRRQQRRRRRLQLRRRALKKGARDRYLAPLVERPREPETRVLRRGPPSCILGRRKRPSGAKVAILAQKTAVRHHHHFPALLTSWNLVAASPAPVAKPPQVQFWLLGSTYL